VNRFHRWLRILLLPAVLVVGVGLYFGLGLGAYLDFEVLAKNREWLLDQVSSNWLAAAAAFLVIYAAAVAISVPGATILTITGGFLFGIWFGTTLAVVGATLGATLLFMLARTTFRELFRRKAAGYLTRLERGFKENAISYMLFLRLVPLVPFWLVNLVPALLNVSLRIFILGTFVGIIPGTFVYASVGNGLGAILEQGGTPDLGLIFSPEILLPILGLAVLALVPAVYRKIRGASDVRELPNG
jgi:uncharacterized membrane protein YdjX (TVP38/TMEM64 family)